MTYDDAIIIATEGLGDDVLYSHRGGLPDGGDRTIVWASEHETEGDYGAYAHAVIRRTSR
jgi:hypothetical protein